MRDQTDNTWERFAVIVYNHGQFVYSARQGNSAVSSYICQLPQQGLLVSFYTKMLFKYLLVVKNYCAII